MHAKRKEKDVQTLLANSKILEYLDFKIPGKPLGLNLNYRAKPRE